jgi:hypothetical protein
MNARRKIAERLADRENYSPGEWSPQDKRQVEENNRRHKRLEHEGKLKPPPRKSKLGGKPRSDWGGGSPYPS